MFTLFKMCGFPVILLPKEYCHQKRKKKKTIVIQFQPGFVHVRAKNMKKHQGRVSTVDVGAREPSAKHTHYFSFGALHVGFLFI